MTIESVDNTLIEMFGLTLEQSSLMFSMQKMIVENDLSLSKRNQETKKLWLREWEKGISEYLKCVSKETNNDEFGLIDRKELAERFSAELKKSDNRTWYYILILECLEFTPYTTLGTDNDKAYSKLKFDVDKNYDFAKNYFVSQGYVSAEKIDRIDKTYCKSLSHISGNKLKLITKTVIVIAISAIAAAIAAVFAGPIAVGIFGAGFEGLKGIALMNACLALAGGGAIAIGGHGMAMGVAIIAGGGALLGLAAGGTTVGALSLFASSPEFTLTQAAKLETILKEVILNAQQDVVSAQKILARYKEQISELSKKLSDLEMENEKNKKEIKAIRESLKYLKTSYKDMNVFASAYEVGLQQEMMN